MTYVEGFLVAVPTANKDKYIAQAEAALPFFREFGATRMVEGWGDDVPRGEVNDLYGAVQAKDDETVVFSWIEYPDKSARDSANEKMHADPRMKDMGSDMAFDGMRMVYSGFAGLHEEGAPGKPGYVDGIVLPVPVDKKDDYADFCRRIDSVFMEHGATRVIDTWGDDLMEGKVTDFHRAVHRKDGETVVFSWVEWPSKAVRDEAWGKLMSDERLSSGDRPFDGRRMIFGGFTPVVDG